MGQAPFILYYTYDFTGLSSKEGNIYENLIDILQIWHGIISPLLCFRLYIAGNTFSEERSVKIDILEDHQALGHILQLSLGLAGHTVHTSETILEFLTFVTTPAPADLIIVDFYLLAEGTEVQLSGADVIR